MVALGISYKTFSQDQELKENHIVADFDDIYIYNELLYKNDTDSLYSGLIHRTKKNGELLQEDYVERGIIHYTLMFYRRQKRKPHSKYIYNKDNPYLLREEIRYHLEGDVFKITYYDYDGRKILVEDFEDGKMVYSCEFNGRKRHGKEFCITKECDTTVVYYVNGRKKKSKFNRELLR